MTVNERQSHCVVLIKKFFALPFTIENMKL